MAGVVRKPSEKSVTCYVMNKSMVAILLHSCGHRSDVLRSVLVRLCVDVVTYRCVWSHLEEAQSIGN